MKDDLIRREDAAMCWRLCPKRDSKSLHAQLDRRQSSFSPIRIGDETMKLVQITLSDRFVTLNDTHSFCESIASGPDSPWHIREHNSSVSITLCGRPVSAPRWEVQSRVGLSDSICPKCLEVLKGSTP